MSKKLHQVLLKKGKQDYKKPQKVFWRSVCFGIPSSCLSGARQQLTSSTGDGQTPALPVGAPVWFFPSLHQPQQKVRSTNLQPNPFPPPAVGHPEHPVSLEAAAAACARPGNGPCILTPLILQLSKAHKAPHPSHVFWGDFGVSEL